MWTTYRSTNLAAFLTLCFCAKLSTGAGLFEVDVKSFENIYGQIWNGNCCDGVLRDHNGYCKDQCDTVISVCLKEYQDLVRLSGPCSYGNVTSPVLGGNILKLSEADNPKRKLLIPFTFNWTERFSMVITVSDSDVLNSGKRIQSKIVTFTHHGHLLQSKPINNISKQFNMVSLRFNIQLKCDQGYHGETCGTFCNARDDILGHWDCDVFGNKVCKPGWDGLHCTEPQCSIDCVHGSCIMPEKCRCKAGWRGPHCNICVPHPNCDHGTCNSTAFACNCDAGWGGEFCNKDLNYCDRHHPCQNGAYCIPLLSQPNPYKCRCIGGYTGNRCEIAPPRCTPGTCINGGTCRETQSFWRCQCTSPWTGERCDRRADSCFGTKCVNALRCPRIDNSVKCVCLNGWTGPYCDISQSTNGNQRSTCHSHILNRQYAEGETWREDCNFCRCFAGRPACTKNPCSVRICAFGAGSHMVSECSADELCAMPNDMHCFTPPCSGRCVPSSLLILPSQSNSPCLPSRATRLNNNCARILLAFDKTMLPIGLTVDSICSVIKRLPGLHKRSGLNLERLSIDCGIDSHNKSLIVIALSSRHSLLSSVSSRIWVRQAADRLSQMISQQMGGQVILGALTQIKVETAIGDHSSSAYVVPIACSIIGLVGMFAVLMLVIWHSRRMGAIRRAKAHAESLEHAYHHSQNKVNNANNNGLQLQTLRNNLRSTESSPVAVPISPQKIGFSKLEMDSDYFEGGGGACNPSYVSLPSSSGTNSSVKIPNTDLERLLNSPHSNDLKNGVTETTLYV